MTKTTSLHRCECAAWSFDLDVDREDDYTTGCQAMTIRTFAQGHDAKLVGFMVRAEIQGHDISKAEGGMLVTYNNAVLAAASISNALAVKVEGQLEAARTRIRKAAVKKLVAPVTKKEIAIAVAQVEAEKAEVDPAPTSREARIKVGRWTYQASIQTETGEATYATKLGGTKTAPAGTYTEM